MLSLTNTPVIGNKAGGNGGGVFNPNAYISQTNSSVTGNTGTPCPNTVTPCQ
jgi:hypothetical protein